VLKKFFKLFNNTKSFLCKLITNLHATRQPNLYLLSFIIVNIKEPSPSVNPVTYEGSNLGGRELCSSEASSPTSVKKISC